ncbi:MAG: hypothetical protein F6K47_01840 [Symploca sp. SIO2E6]|nr:hypothetical protein [Symploca sp. SIO2E6]
MLKTINARDVTLQELETAFHLQLTEDEEFFPEWRENLPAITDWQRQLLNQVKAGYENLIKQPLRLYWYNIHDVGAQCLRPQCLRPPASMFSNQKAKLLIIPIQPELILYQIRYR